MAQRQRLRAAERATNGAAPHRGRRAGGNGEAMRDRIFRVATELFARNGFDATGVQELSEAIGLGRGALYYHIKSKDDLLFEICASLLDDMIERASEIVARDLPVEERIRELAHVQLRELAEKRDAWTVSLSELRALPPTRRDEIVGRRNHFEQIWAELLDEGAQDGTLRPVDPIILRGILGMLNSTHLWIQTKGRMQPEQVADVLVGVLMDGLRPR